MQTDAEPAGSPRRVLHSENKKQMFGPIQFLDFPFNGVHSGAGLQHRELRFKLNFSGCDIFFKRVWFRSTTLHADSLRWPWTQGAEKRRLHARRGRRSIN